MVRFIVFFIGPGGSGKSSLIRSYTNSVPSEITADTPAGTVDLNTTKGSHTLYLEEHLQDSNEFKYDGRIFLYDLTAAEVKVDLTERDCPTIVCGNKADLFKKVEEPAISTVTGAGISDLWLSMLRLLLQDNSIEYI